MITPEQLRQTADAMEADERGEPVEYLGRDGQWYLSQATAKVWDLSFPHRPKPKPAMHPWSKPDDVPGPVCWIRNAGQPSLHMLVTTVWIAGIRFNDASSQQKELHFDHGVEKWGRHEYSTDRKTWQPCTISA